MLEQTMAEKEKDKKKVKYLSKTVKFAGKNMTLYSLDGMTWSSRKDELHQILERQDQERAAFNQMIGDAAAKPKTPEGEEGQGETAESSENEEMLEMDELDVIEEAVVEDAPVKTKGRAAKLKGAKLEESPAKGKISKKEKPMASPKARASLKATPKKASKVKAKKRVA